MVGFHRPVYTVQTGVVRAPRVGDWDEGKIRGGGGGVGGGVGGDIGWAG